MVAHLDRREIAAIFVGGALGTLLRVWLSRSFPSGAGDWPWATFAVNISGSFALALIVTHLERRSPRSRHRRPLLASGFCGAYTTFSTMQLEILRMLEHDRYGLAGAYVMSSVLAGYAAVQVGTVLVRRGAIA